MVNTPLHNWKKPPKRFSSFMYLVSIYVTFVFQEMAKLWSKTKTKKFRRELSIDHVKMYHRTTKVKLNVDLSACCSVWGHSDRELWHFRSQLQVPTLWPSPNLLNQNIYCNKIPMSSLRTLKFGNDVCIDGSQTRLHIWITEEL